MVQILQKKIGTDLTNFITFLLLKNQKHVSSFVSEYKHFESLTYLLLMVCIKLDLLIYRNTLAKEVCEDALFLIAGFNK